MSRNHHTTIQLPTRVVWCSRLVPIPQQPGAQIPQPELFFQRVNPGSAPYCFREKAWSPKRMGFQSNYLEHLGNTTLLTRKHIWVGLFFVVWDPNKWLDKKGYTNSKERPHFCGPKAVPTTRADWPEKVSKRSLFTIEMVRTQRFEEQELRE